MMVASVTRNGGQSNTRTSAIFFRFSKVGPSSWSSAAQPGSSLGCRSSIRRYCPLPCDGSLTNLHRAPQHIAQPLLVTYPKYPCIFGLRSLHLTEHYPLACLAITIARWLRSSLPTSTSELVTLMVLQRSVHPRKLKVRSQETERPPLSRRGWVGDIGIQFLAFTYFGNISNHRQIKQAGDLIRIL